METSVKYALYDLDALTDLRARANTVRSKLDALEVHALRLSHMHNGEGYLVLLTLGRDCHRGDCTYVPHNDDARYSSELLGRVVDVVRTGLQAELADIANRVDIILSAHCDRATL